MNKRLARDAIQVPFLLMHRNEKPVLSRKRFPAGDGANAGSVTNPVDRHGTNIPESFEANIPTSEQEEELFSECGDDSGCGLPFSDAPRGEDRGGWEDFDEEDKSYLVQDDTTKAAEATCNEKKTLSRPSNKRQTLCLLRVRHGGQRKERNKKFDLDKYIGSKSKTDKWQKIKPILEKKKKELKDVLDDLDYLKTSQNEYAYDLLEKYALEMNEKERKKRICEGA